MSGARPQCPVHVRLASLNLSNRSKGSLRPASLQAAAKIKRRLFCKTPRQLFDKDACLQIGKAPSNHCGGHNYAPTTHWLAPPRFCLVTQE
jgi:hypothetical protein